MKVRRTAVALTVAGLLLPLWSTGPARAQGPVVVSTPGNWLSTYTTPAAVAQQGGQLTYVNGDLPLHDVVADDVYGSDDQSWCGPIDPSKPEDPLRNPRRFPLGKCPLFWTPLISLGQQTPVLGLEATVPGTLYPFTCSIHPNMIGRLLVVPPA